jgi:GNAT superfamily N-acetyltransferase
VGGYCLLIVRILSMSEGEAKEEGVVVVRPLVEGDGVDAARIWGRGLEQTVSAASFIMRPLLRYALSSLRVSAMSVDGDFGPSGCNFYTHWANKTDRLMFIAEIDGITVGCCGFKRGTDEKEIVPVSCDFFSVWRLSVDEAYRGRGVAHKLMATGEAWAKSNGGTKIILQTANAIASKFYVKIGYKPVGFMKIQHEKYI